MMRSARSSRDREAALAPPCAEACFTKQGGEDLAPLPSPDGPAGHQESRRCARSSPSFFCLSCLAAPPGHAADVLNIGIAGDPGPLDPARSGNFLDRNIFASLCDKLIDTDPEMRFVPQLATSWEWSADGLALTLHLRAGVSFQDGTPFDAERGEGEYRARQDARHEPAQAGAAARLLRRSPRPAHREDCISRSPTRRFSRSSPTAPA